MSARDADVRAFVAGDHRDPFAYLGMHADAGRLVVRAFLPEAEAVSAVDASSEGPAAVLRRLHPAGLFEGEIAGRAPFPYRLRVREAGIEHVLDDPYRFDLLLDAAELARFARGAHPAPHRLLGAHPLVLDGSAGTRFAVWAPNARRVSVVGDFNRWDGRRHPMRLRHDAGVWELFLPGIGPGAPYKFEIKHRSGMLLPLKGDPYARETELRPGSASVVAAPSGHRWTDEAWMSARAAASARDAPIAIYEVHAGSWRRGPDNRFLDYRELADSLVPYVADMGFTHIELLPLAEHPFDGSWGYQPTALYAPTRRFGTPDGLRHLVDACHRAGIGVLLDWVPGHFPSDPHGLAVFDGTHLYEHEDPRLGRHRDWDTLIYNYGRHEVAGFLLASARYWLEEFHIDGLRVDAVASMLCLDYSRGPGEWLPNRYGGRENLEAIDFLRRVNEAVYADFRGIVTVAEDSTAWPMVSRPTYLGGLGFGYKWNMGWMHDTLSYIGRDPVHRAFHHDELTFGLLYAFSENFVLPLSHDEVVHGKGSLIGKMPGDRWQKFANLRLYLAFTYGHPGKKLVFMGGEFAQAREWDHDRPLDWDLLADPMHRGVQTVVRDLNRLYRRTPALHRRDCEPQGFEWIDCHDREQSVISFLRRDDAGDHVVVVCNFTPVVRAGYVIGVPAGGQYVELLNTDSAFYGGSDVGNGGVVAAADAPRHGLPHSLTLTLPPLGALFLRPRRPPADA